MTMKREYTCNICTNLIEKPINMYGVNFSNLTDFALGGYACTEGQHICSRCALQLKKHLNSEPISKELKQYENDTYRKPNRDE